MRSNFDSYPGYKRRAESVDAMLAHDPQLTLVPHQKKVTVHHLRNDVELNDFAAVGIARGTIEGIPSKAGTAPSA
jgi:hypothetical protein